MQQRRELYDFQIWRQRTHQLLRLSGSQRSGQLAYAINVVPAAARQD